VAWKRIWHKQQIGAEDSLFAVERTSSEQEARARWQDYKRKGETWDDFVGHKRHQFFYDTRNSGLFTSRQAAINAEKTLFKEKQDSRKASFLSLLRHR
jgi:hypothetical protein